MGLFQDITNRFGGKRWRIFGGGASALAIDSLPFARAVVSLFFDKINDALIGTRWGLTSGSTETFAKFVYFFETHAPAIVVKLYADGIVYVACDDSGFYKIVEKDTEAVVYRFISDDFRIYGMTTQTLCRPVCDLLNNTLNASNTSIKRLGVMAFLMPKTDAYGNGLTADELANEESKLQTDYGILQDQKVIKITNHDYTLATLNIGGANLQIDARLQQSVKILCDKLRVPYELVSCAIIGNPNQTGVYQSEAMKRLFVTISAYCEIFVKFAKSLGIVVEHSHPNAPQSYETEWEELTARALANIKEAELAGYITHEQAINLYNQKITKYE